MGVSEGVSSGVSPGLFGAPRSARERKTHKHKQICWDCPETGRVAKVCFCVFLGVIPYGGETHINKTPPPENAGTIP